MQLANSRVIITGASRGIGRELAHHLAARGASLTCIARESPELRDLGSELGARIIPCDLSSGEATQTLSLELESEGFDVLINNASHEAVGDFTVQSYEEISRTLRLNLLAPIALSRAMLPRMVARRCGMLVQISSLAGSAAFPGMAVYASTKGGLNQFNGALRADLKGTGVRTLLVELGPVRTDMLSKTLDWPRTRQAYKRAYRLRALVDFEPAEVASRIADAIEADRQHLRIPTRAAGLAVLPEVSRRLARMALIGQ